MYRYYEYCEQKHQEEDINKSLSGSTNLSSIKASTKNSGNESNNTSGLLSSTGKIPYQVKINDEVNIGKK